MFCQSQFDDALVTNLSPSNVCIQNIYFPAKFAALQASTANKSKLTSQLISCENKTTHVTHLSLRPHAGLQGHICYQQWQAQYPGGRSYAAHVSKL